MIIFFYGLDGFRLKQNLDKIVEEYKKQYSGLSYSILDFNELGRLVILEDAVKTVSFFEEATSSATFSARAGKAEPNSLKRLQKSPRQKTASGSFTMLHCR